MIYFDNASTTFPKPPDVIAAMLRFMTECGVSPGRGGYRAAVESGKMVTDVRNRITNHIGAGDPDHTIFTASCTDALNYAIHGVLRSGDHVVTTNLEHNSVSRPLETLRADGIITVTRVPFDQETGIVSPAAVKNAITAQTRLVTMTHASNVTGVIQPVAEVGEITRAAGAYLLVDAAQTVGLLEIDVAAMHIDMLTFPTHKELLGPPGVGILCVHPDVNIRPIRQGGTGIDSVHPVQPPDWPAHLECGTPNVVGVAGVQAALDHLDPPRTLAHVRAMLDRLIERCAHNTGIRIVGPPGTDCRVGTLALQLDGFVPDEVGAILDESFDVAVRTGLQCAPYAHRQLGTFPDGVVRISPGPFTTEADVDHLAEALIQIVS